MAKRPNISREEILQACWKLIEQKQYPNIPRLANYFIQLDGRKCSNTTLLKSLNEWQEMFDEQQDTDAETLSDLLKMPFEQFRRDAGKRLKQLLDEKQHSLEERYDLKLQSIDSTHLSLNQQVMQQEEALLKLNNKMTQDKAEITSLIDRLEYSERRTKEISEHNQILRHQLDEKHQQNEALRLNNAQLELNLAKQDQLIAHLTNQLAESKQQLNQMQNQIEQSDSRAQQTQIMQQQLKQLQLDMAQLIKSHGANK